MSVSEISHDQSEESICTVSSSVGSFTIVQDDVKEKVRHIERKRNATPRVKKYMTSRLFAGLVFIVVIKQGNQHVNGDEYADDCGENVGRNSAPSAVAESVG